MHRYIIKFYGWDCFNWKFKVVSPGESKNICLIISLIFVRIYVWSFHIFIFYNANWWWFVFSHICIYNYLLVTWSTNIKFNKSNNVVLTIIYDWLFCGQQFKVKAFVLYILDHFLLLELVCRLVKFGLNHLGYYVSFISFMLQSHMINCMTYDVWQPMHSSCH